MVAATDMTDFEVPSAEVLSAEVVCIKALMAEMVGLEAPPGFHREAVVMDVRKMVARQCSEDELLVGGLQVTTEELVEDCKEIVLYKVASREMY